MLKLEPEEKILLVLHHHWIAIISPAIVFGLLIIAPEFLLPLTANSANPELFNPLIRFFADIWRLVILLLGFIFWMNYYLDALVITTTRAMNVKQNGVFRYEIEEFKLERVQNVTVDVPGFFATMLGYGDITIETAGEIDFTINTVPRAMHAKDLIVEYSKSGKQF